MLSVHLASIDSTEALSTVMVRTLSLGCSLNAVEMRIIPEPPDPVIPVPPCTLWCVCALVGVSPSLQAIPAPILVIHPISPCIFLHLSSVATKPP